LEKSVIGCQLRVFAPMEEEFHQILPTSLLGPCACSQVRRVARKLSAHYDAILSPEGLTITQYSLIVNIQRAGQLSHSFLAEKVGMERTTLTRNLRPLIRAGWVTVAAGKDRRQHLLQLTETGKQKLIRSLPLWEQAQSQFLSRIGSQSLQELRALLALAESAVNEVTAKQQNPERAPY
jgi:DNA-binding MarR family transcriptional regulator